MTGDFLASLARWVSGASARWLGCEPGPGQRIYFANHASHLDALVIWSLLPPELRPLTRPVAARDYWTKGALRRHLAEKVFRAILIERKKPTAHANPLVQILEGMGSRESIILFPEGTRTTGAEPGPFKAGLYHLARKCPEVELVPVYLENLNRILPRGEILPIPLLGCVTFGSSIRLLQGEAKQAFLERARTEILRLRDA